VPVPSDAELLQQTILFFMIEQKRVLARHVPITQARMLSALLRNGPISQVELGRRMGLEKSWISRAVDKLVEQGWVERSQNEQDRRAFDLELTPQGLAQARLLRADLEAHAKSVLERLDPEARATVMQAMRLLDGVIERPESSPTPAV
jgi:DNA-binding MarR family transcriptional regulator